MSPRPTTRRVVTISPVLQARFISLARLYAWDDVSAAVTRCVAMLREDAAAIPAKRLPHDFAARLDGQHAALGPLSESRAVRAGDAAASGTGLAGALASARSFLATVRELGIAAYDNEERYDAKKLAIFTRGHGPIGRNPERTTKAVIDAIARVRGSRADLEAINDGPDLLTTGRSVLAQLKVAGASKALVATKISPDVLAFITAKGKLIAMLKRASRAGVATFKTRNPTRAAEYTLRALGLRETQHAPHRPPPTPPEATTPTAPSSQNGPTSS